MRTLPTVGFNVEKLERGAGAVWKRGLGGGECHTDGRPLTIISFRDVFLGMCMDFSGYTVDSHRGNHRQS